MNGMGNGMKMQRHYLEMHTAGIEVCIHSNQGALTMKLCVSLSLRGHDKRYQPISTPRQAELDHCMRTNIKTHAITRSLDQTESGKRNPKEFINVHHDFSRSRTFVKEIQNSHIIRFIFPRTSQIKAWFILIRPRFKDSSKIISIYPT
jgi:hypothetical protein